MSKQPNQTRPNDPRLRVADLIANIRDVLAGPDAAPGDLAALLRLLADAAAAAIAEPVMAIDVMPGDTLLLDGSTVTITSAPRPGTDPIGGTRQHGVALDWQESSRRGVIFRRADQLLTRLPRREGPRVIAAVRPDSATGGGARPVTDDAS